MENSTNMTKLPWYIDPMEPITSIATNSSRALFALVTLEGRVYISHRKKLESPVDKQSRTKWKGQCIYQPSNIVSPATSVAFNPTFTNIAIGNLHGVVHIYELGMDEYGVTANFSHAMALKMPGGDNVPIKLGAVAALSWTDDGYALAVGWLWGGASVWSVFGSLLMSTITEDTFVHASDGVMTETNELFFTGVQDLFWSSSGFDLFLLPSTSFSTETIREIFIVPFAKSSLLNCHSWNNGRHICLLGSDRILLYAGLQSGISPSSIDPINWETIHIPAIYLADNWPIKVNFFLKIIKLVSVNSSGHFMAIAGLRGFAHYNGASGKWKLFGNEQQVFFYKS